MAVRSTLGDPDPSVRALDRARADESPTRGRRCGTTKNPLLSGRTDHSHSKRRRPRRPCLPERHGTWAPSLPTALDGTGAADVLRHRGDHRPRPSSGQEVALPGLPSRPRPVPIPRGPRLRSAPHALRQPPEPTPEASARGIVFSRRRSQELVATVLSSACGRARHADAGTGDVRAAGERQTRRPALGDLREAAAVGRAGPEAVPIAAYSGCASARRR